MHRRSVPTARREDSSSSESGGLLGAASCRSGRGVITVSALLCVALSIACGPEPQVRVIRFPKDPVVLEGHEAALLDASFDPAGDRVVTASEDGTARVWSTEGEQLRVLGGHEGKVRKAGFNPGGGPFEILTLDEKVARLWSGGVPQALEGHADRVTGAAFSPDGSRLATASHDGELRIWSVGAGEVSRILEAPPGETEVAFSSDGSRLLTWGREGARAWSVEGAGEPANLARNAIRSAAVSPDGSRVATVGRRTYVAIHDLGADARVRTVSAGRLDVLFHPDGSRLLAFIGDEAELWDLDPGGDRIELPEARFQSWETSAAFSADGALLAVGHKRGEARIWTVASLDRPFLVAGHADDVTAVAFNPAGSRLVTASKDGTARIWRTGPGEFLRLGHPKEVTSAAFSADGSRIVTLSWGTAYVWRADGTGNPIAVRGEEEVRGAVLHPDGKRLITTHSDKLRVWRLGDRKAKVVGTSRLYDGKSMKRPVLSGDGSFMAVLSSVSGLGDRLHVRRYEGENHYYLGPGREIPCTRLRDVDIDRAASRVLCACADGRVLVWKSGRDRRPAVLRGHEDGVGAAAFSPDGSRILTAEADGTARIWRSDGRGQPRSLVGHQARLLGAAYSADGKRAVTTSEDGTVRVWDVRGKRPLFLLLGHEHAVLDAAFSPDGLRLVTASWDGTARVWPIPR